MPYNFPMGNIYGTRTIKGEKLLPVSTFVQNDVLLLTEVLVITRFLRVNKASPATRVINQNMTEICFAASDQIN